APADRSARPAPRARSGEWDALENPAPPRMRLRRPAPPAPAIARWIRASPLLDSHRPPAAPFCGPLTTARFAFRRAVNQARRNWASLSWTTRIALTPA